MPLVLGIESTCDETAAAVVSGTRVLSNVIVSQIEDHAVFGGVVPEIAGRMHVEAIVPTVRQAIAKAGVERTDLDAIAVANRPGLIGSLVVGTTAAKTLAWTLGKPLVGVDHVRAHLHSVLLDQINEPALPAVGLVVSGGHTSLYVVRSWHDITRIGRTIDDAVGEAYDKAAAMLGLGYPGGPIIDRLATHGNSNALDLPRPLLGRESLDFSFSGLKTALLYAVFGEKGRARLVEDVTEQEKADACASFQAACIAVLTKKLQRAIDQTSAKSILIGGGVSANRGLRAAVERLPVPTFVPHPQFCTDNAAMIAGLGHVLHDAGETSPLDLHAYSTVRD
jgi:N6-L-threonylcarbamoyladenine synthase